MEANFTEKQGQYLSFIAHYIKVNGRSPAESDIQRYFKVSPPTVHQVVVKLESLGLITNTAAQTAEALTYQDVYRYDEVYPDDEVDQSVWKSLNTFLAHWLHNCIDQGHRLAD